MASKRCFAGNVLLVFAFSSLPLWAANSKLELSALQKPELVKKSSKANLAANTATNTADGRTSVSNWKWKGKTNGLLLPPGLPQDEFELMLEQRFYGTYVIYSKLNRRDKTTVYYQYRKAVKPDLENVHQDILELLK